MILDAAAPTFAASVADAATTFVRFVERRLGVHIVRNARTAPYGRVEYETELAYLERLTEAGIINGFAPVRRVPDEPQLLRWLSTVNNASAHPVSGADLFSERTAILATAGEALERYLWQEAVDHFIKPTHATEREIATRGSYISPSAFAGISPSQRKQKRYAYDDTTKFLWIRARSLNSSSTLYVPAQSVTGSRTVTVHSGTVEPVLRQQITTGAAVWPTQSVARLRGLYELLERDAYMIWWLNQLTLPRLALTSLTPHSSELSTALKILGRYRLKVHAIELITGAPVTTIMTIIEDTTGNAPRFSFGLKSGKSAPECTLGALPEALRARAAVRQKLENGYTWDHKTPIEKIGHLDRLYYWASPDNTPRLEKFVQTPEKLYTPEAWKSDSDDAHLARITAWCREMKYDCYAVSPGDSKKNVLPWKMEVVAIPQLQPTHLNETVQHAYGARLTEVPRAFGYTPRSKPYTEAPHPFA